MSGIMKPFRWFYHEFGLGSIHDTGRNAYLIILARTCRMFAFGTNSLILAIFLSALDYTDHQIGLFMTLTLLGDLFLGTFLTLIADRIGRRKVLVGGSVLMILSGFVFAFFENFWILLVAAVLGVISVTGGDFGPFRSIEESVISQLTTPSTRADVLAWYVAVSSLGSGLGSEASGRIVQILQHRQDWTIVDAYHALFWIYAAMGLINLVLVLGLTEACEFELQEKVYAQLAQNEADVAGLGDQHAVSDGHVQAPARRGWPARILFWFSDKFIQISAPTRSIMYKLWFLLSVDSLADGMVPISLTNYYMDIKFNPSKSTLGDITSISYVIGAISSTYAGALARRIGLINTMVFTHVPSSAAVLFFPFPPVFWLTAALLLLRTGLNPMDQAPRTAFIAAVVKPEERTAVMGITAMLRTLASMAGPSVTGVLAQGDTFWIAFVAAGLFRLAYDFGLWALFVNMDVGEDVSKNRHTLSQPSERHDSDSEEDLEMQSLADSDGTGDTDSADKVEGRLSHVSTNLQVAPGLERIRSRSPHRSTNE